MNADGTVRLVSPSTGRNVVFKSQSRRSNTLSLTVSLRASKNADIFRAGPNPRFFIVQENPVGVASSALWGKGFPIAVVLRVMSGRVCLSVPPLFRSEEHTSELQSL